MPQMITNADGSQSEVFTKVEMDAAEKKATDTATAAATDAATKLVDGKIEEYKKQNPPAAEAIEKLKKDMTEKDEKITELEKAAKGDGDGGDGDGDDKKTEAQIKRLREDRDKMKEELEGKITEMGKQLTAVIGDAKTDLIKKAVEGASQSDIEAAGGKEQFKEKLELKYDSFAGEALTPTQIAERVGESITLVTGNKPTPGMMDNATGGSGKGDEDHKGNQPKDVSESTKNVGNSLGISEEDRKTYGPGGEKHKTSSSVS